MSKLLGVVVVIAIAAVATGSISSTRADSSDITLIGELVTDSVAKNMQYGSATRTCRYKSMNFSDDRFVEFSIYREGADHCAPAQIMSVTPK